MEFWVVDQKFHQFALWLSGCFQNSFRFWTKPVRPPEPAVRLLGLSSPVRPVLQRRSDRPLVFYFCFWSFALGRLIGTLALIVAIVDWNRFLISLRRCVSNFVEFGLTNQKLRRFSNSFSGCLLFTHLILLFIGWRSDRPLWRSDRQVERSDRPTHWELSFWLFCFGVFDRIQY